MVSQRGRDQIDQSRMALACHGTRRVTRISASLIRLSSSSTTESSYAYCPALSALGSANRENTATHWQNNTLSARLLPHTTMRSTKLRPVTPDSHLFPTLG